jgi:hypothetical protein
MPTIKLASPWTFRTPELTIDYPEGSHTVDADIHAAALAAGVIEGKTNGNGSAKTGATGDTDPPQG